jgi:hypothetical protein
MRKIFQGTLPRLNLETHQFEISSRQRRCFNHLAQIVPSKLTQQIPVIMDQG